MAFNQLAAAGVTIYAITKPLDMALKRIKGELGSLASKPIEVNLDTPTIGGRSGGVLGAILGIGGAAFTEVTGLFGMLGRMLGSVVTGGAAAATAGMTALGGASFYAAKQANTLEMEMHRNKEIFGQTFPLVEQTIMSLKSLGYTRTELAGMSADLGLMFVGMGLNTKATAQLSSQFLKLGVDASMLYGMELPEFMEKLEAGIGGANRGLHRMGIFIDENKVQWEKWRLASQGAIWMTDEQGTQMARTSLIMRGLSKAAGQANWAHRQFGGTLRETQGRLSEMWVTFGEAVKPAWTRIIMKVNELLKQMGEWLERNKALIKSWADYIADILIFVVNNWRDILDAIRMTAINVGTAMLNGIIGAVDGIKAAVGGVGGFFMDKFKAIGEIISLEFGYAFNTVSTIIGNFKDNAVSIFTTLWNNIKSGFLSVVSKVVWGLSYLEKPFKMFVNVILASFDVAVKGIQATIIPILDLMVAMGKLDKESVKKFKLFKETPKLDTGTSVLAEISTQIAKVAAEAAEKAKAAPGMKGLMEGAPQFQAAQIAKAMDRLMSVPMPTLRGFMDIMKDAGVNVAQWVEPLTKIFKQFKAMQEAEAKKRGQRPDRLGPGMQNPLIPGGNRIEGGFVGIADFAKRIQEGALGKDAAMIATARNTQMMAQMMAQWGPALIQNLVNAGMVGP